MQGTLLDQILGSPEGVHPKGTHYQAPFKGILLEGILPLGNLLEENGVGASLIACLHTDSLSFDEVIVFLTVFEMWLCSVF